jgi:tetratricopeptide (TPR) repeat protein
MKEMRRVLAVSSIVMAVLVASYATVWARQAPPTLAEITVVVKQAFRAAYNLDEKEALATAHRSVAMGPDEPTTHRALASILWLDILFKRGAVVTDHYITGGLKAQVALPKPPADLDAEFKKELDRAIELAEARVRRDPGSLQARFDAGTAYALQASYAATVEGSVLGALRLAKRAYDAQEYVLSRDPQRVEAGLIVGTYRYLVSSLALPARMIAYVVGFGGGKERGIAQIEAASRAVDTHVDAKVALLLIYNREGRPADALRMAKELGAEFPRNRIFTLEAGSAATRAGRPVEADALLTQGLAALDKDDRNKFPGEQAIWLYKRAVARIALRRGPDAHADLVAALQTQPAEWIKGRIELELGKLADAAGHRQEALAAYRTAQDLCGSHNDGACAAEAARLMTRPFKF